MYGVPSSSLDKDFPGDSSWRKKLDEGGENGADFQHFRLRKKGSETFLPSDHEIDAAFGPPVPQTGSPDDQVSRLEKRLKKNLPNEIRASLESELAALKRQRDKPNQKDSPVAGGARRKIGANGPDQPDSPGEDITTKKYYNKAAPVNMHPKTITRMADWQNELDRRIREQEELNKMQSPGKIQSDPENPLESIKQVVESMVNGLASALGLKEEPKIDAKNHDPKSERPVLPPQTFSRRL
jgi:hypothetical protein